MDKEFIKKENELNRDYNIKIMEFRNELMIEHEKKRITQDLNRARAVSVGTSFGGVVELNMRTDIGNFFCCLQPAEVIELIHTLSGAVGCNANIESRNDFSSWRDWRVSKAEKKHLNGHPPHPNDMALVKDIGTGQFNQANAERISNIIANAECFVNQYDDTDLINRESIRDGADSDMLGIDGLSHNKLLLDENGEIVYVAGGDGGLGSGSVEEQEYYERQANKKPIKTIKKPR